MEHLQLFNLDWDYRTISVIMNFAGRELKIRNIHHLYPLVPDWFFVVLHLLLCIVCLPLAGCWEKSILQIISGKCRKLMVSKFGWKTFFSSQIEVWRIGNIYPIANII